MDEVKDKVLLQSAFASLFDPDKGTAAEAVK